METNFEPNTEPTAAQEETTETYADFCAHTETPEEKTNRNRSTTAMVLGILGDILFPLPLLNIGGLVLSILAVVNAAMNRRYAKEHAMKESGKNIAGRWCGIAGIVLNVLSMLFWLFLLFIFVFVVSAMFGGVTPEIGVFAEEFFTELF